MAECAGNVLHDALEHAVQQLEPQLLPLFSGSRGARERAALPTMHTQVALKTLVALTRFFPEEHRVYRAGKQLELIWMPLVHEPRNAAAAKLLQYYFRLRQDLLDPPESTLRRSLRDIVRAGIEDAAATRDEARMLGCEFRLQQLSTFLDTPLVCAGEMAALGPLARLLLWQQRLEFRAPDEQPGSGVVTPVLMPHLLGVLDRCATLCSASDWTLDYFCNSGLARCLWQLRGLVQFCDNAAGAALLGNLDDHCLDMHLAGSGPAPGATQEWLASLFAAVHRGEVRYPEPRAEPQQSSSPYDTSLRLAGHDKAALDPDLRRAYEAEVKLYRSRLQQDLQAADRKATPQLISLLYKLAWIFAAAENRDWARLCHCAFYVALQFWRIRRPVSAAAHVALVALAQDPGAPLPVLTLRRWRRQLLQDRPCWSSDGKRPIALQAETGHVVTLDAVPHLLSGSFTTLVRAGGMEELPSAEMRGFLLRELALLEKGAAAMKVWPLEQLCTLLIAMYEAGLRDDADLPVHLVQQAHVRLVRMLDQAAAWQEVQSSETLVQSLEAWLEARSACREPLPGVDAGGEQPLREHLLGFLSTLASVLERPVRLHLDTSGIRLDPLRLRQVLECLRPLIKFMLLDQSVDARGRHAMHKPRVSTLSIVLRTTSARLVITAAEDGHEEVLSSAELQRLQRRLPKSAGPLACESRAGHGRSFTFTLN